MERQLQLRQQEETAKKNVTETLKQKREKLRQKEVCCIHFVLNFKYLHFVVKQAAFLHSSTTKNRDIYQSFHRAEEQMKQALKARKAEIKVSDCCKCILLRGIYIQLKATVTYAPLYEVKKVDIACEKN